jgi:DNA (cytosine-5)-methyltransferase 1
MIFFMRNKRTLVSLFSGAGCFDIGFEAAGFGQLLATDIDMDACSTMISNRPRANIICAPIEALDNKAISKSTGLKARELDLLVGGPPCQPFSKSAYGVIGSQFGFEDSRASTVREYFRIVRHLLPRAFVIENVPQFISGKNLQVQAYIERSVARINSQRRTKYKLHYFKVNAASFGVPQIRERLFIIASRDGLPFSFPEVRFGPVADSDLGLMKYRTAWDSIGHLAEKFTKNEELTVGGRWGHLLHSIPPGSNYLWHTNRGGGENVFKWRARYWNFLLKLHPLQPSWTIAAHPGMHTGPFHWNSRRLSLEELQLLQTIPASYVFCGSATAIRRQIGNGVPSAIGELIGKEVRRQLFGERVSSSDLKLIPDTHTRLPKRLKEFQKLAL